MTNQPVFKYYLLALDVMIAAAAFVVPARQYGAAVAATSLHAVLLISLSMTLVLAFWMNDLYKRHVVLTRALHFARIAKAVSVTVVVVGLPLALASPDYLMAEGKTLLVGFGLLSLLLFTALRVIPVKPAMQLLARRNIYKANVLIVGNRESSERAADALAADETSAFNVVGFVEHSNDASSASRRRGLTFARELECALTHTDANEILIAMDDAPYDQLILLADMCSSTGKVVRIYSNLLEVVAEKLNVEFYSALPVIMLSPRNKRNGYLRVKRGADLVIAALGLVLLAPLFAMIALGITASSRGPVIFRQHRIGKGGKPFEFIKFRSMLTDADATTHKEYVTAFISGSGRAQKASSCRTYKIQDDPRIFPFGRFLRKTSLDEFPQLYNVLRGEMSLVGPRPCLPYEWDCYDEWHKNRLEILPGCTGLWQTLGRSSVTFEEMVILDLYYISNMSLWLDLRIVLQTFPVILFGKGGL